MSPHSAFSLVTVAALLAGCGHASPPPVAAHVDVAAPAPPAVTVAAATAASVPDSIRRSAIRNVLAGGIGSFLQKVDVDDHPVMTGGKFHGFRITALRGDSFRGVDLKPGDVVTRVEGMPIEHPEEAIEAFNSLQVASELRVDYERDGVPRMLRFRIVDDEAPGSQAPPATKARR